MQYKTCLVAKSELYRFSYGVIALGWAYVLGLFSFLKASAIEFCLVKTILNIPCPSCGVSRGVMSLIKGDFQAGFLYNPLSYVVLGMMIFIPILLLIDLVKSSSLYYDTYCFVESKLKNPKLATSVGILFSIIWIWNINRGI